MKKQMLLIFCASLLVLITGGAQRPTATDFVPNKDVDTPVTLTVMVPLEREDERGSMIELADWFELRNPSVKLALLFCPREDYWHEMYLSYSQQSLPDLAVMNNVMIPAFHELGVLYDLKSYIDESGIREQIPAKLLDSASINGSCYGIPFTCYTYALLCNMDLLTKYDRKPPENWDDFMDTCEVLLREPAASFAFSAAPGEELANSFLQLMYTTDATLRNLRGAGAVKTFQLLSDLTEKRVIARDCMNWNQADLTRKFAKREVAMILTSSSQIPFLESLDPEFHWVASAIPRADQQKTLFSAESVTVMNPNHLTEIYRFFDYLGEDEVISLRSQAYGSMPVHLGVNSSLFEENGPYGIFSSQFAVSQPPPAMGVWQNISQTIQDAVIDIFKKEKTVEQIAQESYVLVNTYIIDG